MTIRMICNADILILEIPHIWNNCVFYLCVLILYFTKYECVIAITEVKETSSNRLSTASTAAVGGGVAAGLVFLLSLVALCCCWGRTFTRPKHSQVHLENIMATT